MALTSNYRFWPALLIAIWTSCLTTATNAQTDYVWQPGSAEWEKASSWSPGGGPPGAADRAIFGNGTTGVDVITWTDDTGNQEVFELLFAKGSYSFDNLTTNPYLLALQSTSDTSLLIESTSGPISINGLNLKSKGGALIKANSSLSIGEGNRGLPGGLELLKGLNVNGTLEVRAGSVISDSGRIGFDSGGNGTVLLSGSQSTWSVRNELYVGGNGSGGLTIEDGAQLTNQLGRISGLVTVTGDQSVWTNTDDLEIGYLGNAGVTISDGGRVTSNHGIVGDGASHYGAVNVFGESAQGNRSTWNLDGYLGVGNSGSGELNIYSGGLVTATDAYVGNVGSAVGTVYIASDGRLEVSNTLEIGTRSTGAISIDAGGRLQTGSAVIGGVGANSNGSATLAVSGAGAEWNNDGLLYVGVEGAGLLQVESGGLIKTGNGLYLGGSQTTDGSGSGRVNVLTDGTIDVTGMTRLWSGGTLSLQGGQLNTNGFDNSNGGTFQFDDGILNIRGPGASLAPAGTTLTIDSTLGTPTLRFSDDATVNLPGNLSVGDAGKGNLEVAAGAMLENGFGYLGYDAGAVGAATVSGTNSRWDSRNGLIVGRSGTGSLEINDNGDVTAGIVLIGSNTGSSGTVIVSDEGDSGINGFLGSDGDIHIGGSLTGAGGTGQLQIDGGSVRSLGTTKLHTNGSLQITAGTLETRALDLSASNNFNMAGGDIRVTGDENQFGELLLYGTDFSINGGLFLRYVGEITLQNDIHVGESQAGTLSLFQTRLAASNVRAGADNAVSPGNIEVIGDQAMLFANNIALGQSSESRLEIRNGSLVAAQNVFVDPNGSIELSFDNARLQADNIFFHGGSLAVNDNTQVVVDRTIDGLEADINIQGDNASVSAHTFNVDGNGTTNINNGGSLVGVNPGLAFPSTFRIMHENAVANVDGTGSSLTGFESIVVSNGDLNITNAATVETDNLAITGNSSSVRGLVTVDGGSTLTVHDEFGVGTDGHGRLEIRAGGKLISNYAETSSSSTSNGGVGMYGDSIWENSGTLSIGRGGLSAVSTLFESTAQIVTTDLVLGEDATGNGILNLQGDSAHANVSNLLTIGKRGLGQLFVGPGSSITANTVEMASLSGSQALIGMQPADEFGRSGTLTINDTFQIGGFGQAQVIMNGGLVQVGNTTQIAETANVELNAGRFEFGQTTLQEFAYIQATGGSMAGRLDHTGFTDANSTRLSPLQNPQVDLTDVMLHNSGTIHGTATQLGSSLVNTASGELLLTAGDLMRFAGSADNAGEFNNYGGTLRFDGSINNQAGGLVSGRGQFIAEGGWTNSGVIAISGGSTEILGDVHLIDGGQILTSGNSVTTFYDDVVHNGGEIRTSAGSATVFYGQVSGAGSYTGTGDVFFEGDVRPGNSPEIIYFDGNVNLGSSAVSHFELAGLAEGEYDKFVIAGNFNIAGQLMVSLLDDFQIGPGNEFLIAEVGGQTAGQFDGLGEGDQVGIFSGRSLFISYAGGDGNDVLLFSAVPEPGSSGLLLLVGLAFGLRRKMKTA